MEINILEFVKEYKENPVGALEKLEVENYVPFATKRALIDTVIESIIEYDTSLLTYEPMNKHLNFSLTCVVIYTNLTYEDEEGLDAYDALVSSGLLDKIIETFPSVTRISLYASVKSIELKTVDFEPEQQNGSEHWR